MFRSTRARLQSQSQQSSSHQSPELPQTRHLHADHETHAYIQPGQQGHSFASASTATLPERHIVYQSVTGDGFGSKEEEVEAYIKGAEFVTDAWRRGEKEGVLDRVKKRKKRDLPTALRAVEDGVLWYTAPFVPPTTGGLDRHSRHWSPRLPPPKLDSLAPLEPLPAHLLPPVGTLLLPWSAGVNEGSDVDHDAVEFEHGWATAVGYGWGKVSQSLEESDNSIRWSCDDVTESRTSGSTPNSQSNVKSAYRARRRWWSQRMNEEEGANRLWDVVPRPHNLEPQPHPYQPSKRQTKPPRPPDYVLPRFFSLPSSFNSHPFHPRILGYLLSQPRLRVYWAIPIVGSVHIPDWSDYSTSPSMRKAPIPSAGKWVPELDPKIRYDHHVPSSPLGPASTTTLSHSRSMIWTDALLRHFWEDFVVPLYTDHDFPFGSISVRLSGPKPDPYLNLAPPASLRPWSDISSANTPARSVTLPVRPEIGDHIRLYCDARYALSLRTWLNSIEIELASLSPERNDIPFPSPYLPFERIRLVLVGPLGEALTVA